MTTEATPIEKAIDALALLINADLSSSATTDRDVLLLGLTRLQADAAGLKDDVVTILGGFSGEIKAGIDALADLASRLPESDTAGRKNVNDALAFGRRCAVITELVTQLFSSSLDSVSALVSPLTIDQISENPAPLKAAISKLQEVQNSVTQNEKFIAFDGAVDGAPLQSVRDRFDALLSLAINLEVALS